MSFLKRALLAVTRMKGRTAIMFVIFFVIANLVLAGLAIQHATEYAGTLARQQLGGQLTLRYNTQAAMQEARASGEQRPDIQPEPVTDAMVKMIESQKNIIGYNYIVNTNGTADGFTPVTTENDSQTSQSSQDGQNGYAGTGQGRMFGTNGQNSGQSNFVMPDVTVSGVSSTGLVDSFSNGDDKLVEGRHITPDDAGKKVAVIEKNLADQNNLKIGSQITVKATRADASVTYTVVGIYEAGAASTTQSAGMRNMPFTQPYNNIYVDYKSAIPLKAVATDSGVTEGGIDSAVFYIDDPVNMNKAEADIKAMDIDWSKFTLDANDTAYQQLMGPIENVASFSMTVVYVVAVAGAVILALILMLSIKERIYETGVLLSMGEGKLKIITQYLAEVLIIAFIAFGLSVFSGKFIAQGVGDMLLNRETQTLQSQQANGVGGYGGRNFTAGQWTMNGGRSGTRLQAIDSLNIQVTPSELGQMSAAGLLIILAGTILPASSIMRYKPNAILTKAT